MMCESCIAQNKTVMCCNKKKDISVIEEQEIRNTEILAKKKCCVGPAYHVCPLCH